MPDQKPTAPTIIDGKAVAQARLEKLAEQIGDRTVGLGILVATEDSATVNYVGQKRRQGESIGFTVTVRTLPDTCSLEEIQAACREFNDNHAIDGYIVQLPLPDGVDVDAALATVDPGKDADGLTPANLERLYAGKSAVIPATPKGILTLLDAYEIPVKHRPVTVVGQGRLSGKPLAALLEQSGADVTRADKSTTDLAAATRNAEILVVATGNVNLITADMIRDKAVVIDVGINRLEADIVGDIDFDSVSKKASAITPVPGGVGPMTVVSLLENVFQLSRQRAV